MKRQEQKRYYLAPKDLTQTLGLSGARRKTTKGFILWISDVSAEQAEEYALETLTATEARRLLLEFPAIEQTEEDVEGNNDNVE